MKVAAKIDQERTVNEVRAALLGRRCWNVACGGASGSTFQLALGRKIPRRIALRNPKASDEYRRFEGEFGLMVWCSWRLEGPAGPITSSEDESSGLVDGLRRLVGRTVVRTVASEGWNLQLAFSGGLLLSVFPDHVGREWTLGNWELRTPEREYAVGTSLACQVSQRRGEYLLAAKPAAGVRRPRQRVRVRDLSI